MADDGKVLILTTAFNAEKTLRRCVDSVLNQSHENFVYFLLDNGSTDYTREIILEYAAKDKRIRPFFYDYNKRGRAINIPEFVDDADYRTSLDSDDEYLPQFFENTLRFMKENDLEYAVCGYDTIDEETGRLISRKKLDFDTIIEEEDKADKYILYRRYLLDFWSRLFTTSLREKTNTRLGEAGLNHRKYKFSEIYNHETVRITPRFGILAESLHKYYVRPNSLSNLFNPNEIKGSAVMYEFAREFLLGYGEISKQNMDYLAAVYFSHIEKAFINLRKSDMAYSEKITFINEILSDAVFKEVFDESYEPDPCFENLKNRNKFLREIYRTLSEYAYALGGIENEK